MRIDLFREGQRLLAQSPPLFDGSVGVVTVRMNDRCGEDKVSALRFYTDESDIYSVDITDGEAQVPHEVIKTPGFTVAAAYYKADGENVERFLPTEGVFIPVMKNGYGAPDDAIEGENAAPSVLAQLLEKIAGYEAHRAAEVIDHPDGSVTAAKLAAKSIGREKLTDALAAELDKKADGADVGTALAAKADKATTLAGYGIGDAVGISVSYEDKLDTLGEKGVYHIISQYSPDTGEVEGSDWTDYYVIVCPRGQSLFGSGTVPAQIRIKGELISTRYKYLTTSPGGKSWSEWVTLANVSDMNTALAEKVDKEDGKGLSDAASVSVYHANAGNEVLQIVGQDGVTKLTPFYGKQAVDEQMSAFSLGLSEKVDKDTTGLRGLSNAKTVTLSDSISTPSVLTVTEQGDAQFSVNFYSAELTDKMLAKLREQSVPHTTASDYPVTLTDALAGESLRECRIYGSAAGVGDADVSENLFDKNSDFDAVRQNYPPTITRENNTVVVSADGGATAKMGAWIIPANGKTAFTIKADSVAFEGSPTVLIRESDSFPEYIKTVSTFGNAVDAIKAQEGFTKTVNVSSKYVAIVTQVVNEQKITFDNLRITASTYKIPVRLRGKNLFDKDNAAYLIGYFTKNVADITTHANARTIYIPCKPNTTYTISRNTSYSNFHFGYTTALPATGVAVSGAISAASTSITSLTLTTGADAKYLVSYIYNGYSEEGTSNAWNTIIGGIQIELGGAATDYEPYITPQTQTATLKLPLSGGEYIDVLNKKRYASDGTATDITVAGELKTIESGRITIDCTTGVQPPRIEAEYWQDINKAITGMKKGGTENEGQ